MLDTNPQFLKSPSGYGSGPIWSVWLPSRPNMFLPCGSRSVLKWSVWLQIRPKTVRVAPEPSQRVRLGPKPSQHGLFGSGAVPKWSVWLQSLPNMIRVALEPSSLGQCGSGAVPKSVVWLRNTTGNLSATNIWTQHSSLHSLSLNLSSDGIFFTLISE